MGIQPAWEFLRRVAHYKAVVGKGPKQPKADPRHWARHCELVEQTIFYLGTRLFHMIWLLAIFLTILRVEVSNTFWFGPLYVSQ